MFRFMIFNIPVSVQPWFWLTLAFISGQLFVDSAKGIVFLLLFLVAGFVSVLVHELGHALTAQHFGKRPEIVLQAFGGYATYNNAVPLSRKQSLMVTAAGPGIQIVLGLIALAVWRSLPTMDPNLNYFLTVLAAISLIWAVLNLLPILPMDGGRLVETALGPENRRTALLISAITGVVVCIISITVLNQPILAIFVGMFAFQSFKALKEPTWR